MPPKKGEIKLKSYDSKSGLLLYPTGKQVLLDTTSRGRRLLAFHYNPNHKQIINFYQNELGGLISRQFISFPGKGVF